MTTTTPNARNRQRPDSVITEVRRAKVELLKRYNYDLTAMARDARARQSQSGHEVVDKSTNGLESR